MNHEERQIHDAFIDGYLSACGSGARDTVNRSDAEQAWRDENTTERKSRRQGSNPRASD